MPTTKPGQKQYRIVMEEGSEPQLTLLEWAKKRGLAPGQAARCILVDWSDAMNGKPTPFAVAAALSGAMLAPTSPPTTRGASEEESDEERVRRQAALEAAGQFL